MKKYQGRNCNRQQEIKGRFSFWPLVACFMSAVIMRINFATETQRNNSVFLCIQWRQNAINLTLDSFLPKDLVPGDIIRLRAKELIYYTNRMRLILVP